VIGLTATRCGRVVFKREERMMTMEPTTARSEIPGGCRWCGMIHGPACPSVRAIEYYPDGVTVRRVEFKSQEGARLGPEAPPRPGGSASRG
jgi:hypothetical protein